MSLRVPLGFYETTIHFQIPGQDGDVVTSLGWFGHDSVDPPDFTAVCTALAGLQGNISEECFQVGVSFNLGAATADNPVHEEAVSVPGVASGIQHSPETSILVQKRTALGGRQYRGRCYYPGAEKNGVGSDGMIGGSIVVGLQTNWDDMLSDMAGLGDTPQLFHQKLPTSPTDITSYTVQAKIATQRTRLRG